MKQGELWLLETPNAKMRPVLLVTRTDVMPLLHNVVVAPVTSTIRDIPTCIPIGSEHGIDHDSVASFDNLAAVPKSVLTRRLGSLGSDHRNMICAALEALADC